MSNHLKDQKSPYLLQHAENPVHWYAWCSQAFETARQEDKPIFLSIGYSTCHWCHVMAHESFEDEEVARVLNRSFISIKVDREERPDVDAVYMSVCQAMTGSGGWPLTILMTPDQKPFYAGTYLTKHSRYGRMGLTELLLQAAELWSSQREKLLRTGEEVTDWLHTQEHSSASGSSEPSLSLLRRGAAALSESFDPIWGGFGPAPKFPMPHDLTFLMRYAALERDEHSLQMAVRTLECMAAGGIYDHIGGGFSRYSTDEQWLIPHFEKMLYDNALLIYAYAEAYQITKNPLFLSVVRETVGYVLRELTGAEGGFYCGQDADSDGVEGKYYALTPSEIRKVLGDEDSIFFCRFFDITEEGNFEGKSIPHRIGQTDSTNSDMEKHHQEHALDRYGMHQKYGGRFEHQQKKNLNRSDVSQRDEEITEHRLKNGTDIPGACQQSNRMKVDQQGNVSDGPDTPLNDARIRDLCEKVYHYRRIRTSLHTDDKILTSWNGLMIAALARASLICREPSWLTAARNAQQFLETRLRTIDGRLHVRYRDGEAAGTGNLEDYAYYAWALLELYQTAWRAEDLGKAVHAAGQILRFFSDRESGGLYLYASDAEQLISRPKETWDGALPSGNSVSALVFSLLADLTGEERWRTARERNLHYLAGEASAHPSAHCFALLAMSTVLCPSSQLICASAGSEMPGELREYLAEEHRPNLTVLLLTPENRKLLARLAPFTASYPLPDSGSVYYLCRGNTCSAGTRDLQELFRVR